jgi:probable HAF family extracellular repeat protein
VVTFVGVLAGAVALACIGASGSHATPGNGQEYVVVNLTPSGTTGATFGQALGVARHHVVGATTNAAGDLEATVWRPNEAAVRLGTLGGSTSVAHGVNAHGAVVGESLISGDIEFHAFLWLGREMLDLGTLGGASSWSRDIDERGTVVGGAERNDGFVHAFAWRDGQMRDLGTLGGSMSWADAIGNHGEIVGNSTIRDDTATRAVIWDDGPPHDLGTLGGPSSGARDINKRDEVVGWADRPDGTSHAALWHKGDVLDLGTLGGPFSSANGVNRRGQVVGVSTLAGDGASAAFLWDGGPMVDLDSLLPEGSGWHVLEAFAIDDRGRIVAEAMLEDSVHAVLLVPNHSSSN